MEDATEKRGCSNLLNVGNQIKNWGTSMVSTTHPATYFSASSL